MKLNLKNYIKLDSKIVMEKYDTNESLYEILLNN